MKKKIILAVISFILLSWISAVGAYNVHYVLSGEMEQCSLSLLLIVNSLFITENIRQFFLLFLAASALFVIWMLFEKASLHYRSGIIRVTPDILIPTAEGQGQYGTAQFLNPKEYKTYWDAIAMNELFKIKKGGLILGTSKDKKKLCLQPRGHAFVYHWNHSLW